MTKKKISINAAVFLARKLPHTHEYFEEESYINSSPLTETQKELLSNSEVGETRLIAKGLLSFMNRLR